MGQELYWIDNGLHGYKGKIEEDFKENNGRYIGWLNPETPMSPELSNLPRHKWIKRMKEKDEKVISQFKVKRSLTPDKIIDRIEDWEDSDGGRAEPREGEWFNGYIVSVVFGKRGGVEVEGIAAQIRN